MNHIPAKAARLMRVSSFGDIFAGNAVNNRLLPGVIDEATFAALADHLDGPGSISLDLDSMTVRFGDRQASVGLDPVWRMKIMRGWDDIDLTEHHRDAIHAFADARRAKGWTWPATQGRWNRRNGRDGTGPLEPQGVKR